MMGWKVDESGALQLTNHLRLARAHAHARAHPHTRGATEGRRKGGTDSRSTFNGLRDPAGLAWATRPAPVKRRLLP